MRIAASSYRMTDSSKWNQMTGYLCWKEVNSKKIQFTLFYKVTSLQSDAFNTIQQLFCDVLSLHLERVVLLVVCVCAANLQTTGPISRSFFVHWMLKELSWFWVLTFHSSVQTDNSHRHFTIRITTWQKASARLKAIPTVWFALGASAH